jgi:hypothetical protein
MCEVSIYLCQRCFTPAREGGACANCGAEVIGCRPGDPDDPCRKPLMNNKGEVLSRAPMWWLSYRIPELLAYFDET